MCTAYNVGRDVRKANLTDSIRQLLKKTPALMRPTETGPVVLPGGELTPMRWGFKRPWSNAIVNSRDDKLDGTVWRTAFAERRCLIPMTAYYEWSGPRGAKRTHLFTPATDDLFWAAGIWEDSPELGPCYSMITCSPNALVETVHDRMPVVLLPEQRDAFLHFRLHERDFRPPPSLLHLDNDAPNPLRKPKAQTQTQNRQSPTEKPSPTPNSDRPIQGELF